MNYHLPRRSRSLRDLQVPPDSLSPATTTTQAKSPPLSSSQPPTQQAPSRYHLWLSAKSPALGSKTSHSADRVAALAAGRSPTSLSDTVLLSENSLPFWQRTSSLSRRRKVSVPELGSTMTTVQEMPLDSRKSYMLLSWLSVQLLTFGFSNHPGKTTSPQAFLRSVWPRALLQCSRH